MLNLQDKNPEKIIYLNILCQETSKLIKKIKERDIVKTFSFEEKNIYESFVEYFIYVTETNPNLLKDFSFRYDILKSGEHCNFHTDEKLVSAALTLAHKTPVIIISNDSDLKELIKFFKNDIEKGSFNIQCPVHNILLYSDFGDGFKLEMLYKNKQYFKTTLHPK